MTIRRLAAVFAALLLVVLPLTAGGAAAAPPAGPLPSQDPFYTWTGGLNGVAPGAVLRTREIHFAAGEITTPITGTQILYRTTDQQGRPVTTVTTVFRPVTPQPTPKLLSYHTAYDALGSKCDPSYTLQGNNPGRSTLLEQAVIAGYLTAGYTVSVPDYEGSQLEWTIGRQSGYAALDGARAAKTLLQLPGNVPVGLIGYSGGSVPTEYGAEVAPTYAPDLNIVAAAGGGLPVYLAHNLPYVSGTPNWAGVIPALVTAYTRTYGLDTSAFLSQRGKQVVAQVQDNCIAQFVADFPGLTDADMVAPPYTSLLQVPEVARAIQDNVMSRSGTPRVPLFLAVGQIDATGDRVMVTDDVQGLAHTYCTRGVPVNFTKYPGESHGDAYTSFERDAAVFLTGHFAGNAPPSNCASIPPGNSL